MTQPSPSSLLDEPATDTLLIRPPHGGHPTLHFKARGSETAWYAALSNIVANAHAPTLSHQALLAIGPHLIRAREEVGEHLNYRTYNTVKPYNAGEWTRRLHRMPSGTLGHVHQRLIRLSRKYLALDLVNRFFPARLAESKPDDPWDAVFERFLGYVRDEAWFPLDDTTLDTARREWQDRKSQDNGDWLAEYMTTIPLPAIAPVEEFLEDDIVRIFYGLFVNTWVLEPRDLRPYGIDEPHRLNENAICSRIDSREGKFDGLEFPLNFIPVVARIYRRETGYGIIDEPGYEDATAVWEMVPGRFSWENDTFSLRRQWQRAAPLVDRYNAFLAWVYEDTELNFGRAVDTILRAGGVI